MRVGRGTNRCQANQGAGQGAAIGGLKVVAANGWFAARPSGTENVYKIYAESFKSQRIWIGYVGGAGNRVAGAGYRITLRVSS